MRIFKRYKNLILNLKNSIYFLGASIIQLILGIITFPLFAQNLSSTDYSIIGYFSSLQAFFLPFFNLSFYSYYMTNQPKHTEEENQRILMTLIYFLSASNLIVIIVETLILYLYFDFANVSFPLLPYALLLMFMNYFSVYQNFFLVKARMENKVMKFFIVSVAFVLVNVSLGLLLVVGLKMGATGKLGSMLIAQVIFGLLTFKMIFSKIKFEFSIIKDALKFSSPLLLTTLLHFPMRELDKVFLERENNVTEFGLYTIGSSISRYLLTAGTAIFQAFEPDIYRFTHQKNIKKLISVFITVFSIFIVLNLIFTIFSEKLIDLLTSGIYTEAYKYADLLIWSHFFFLLSNALTAILIALKKTRTIFFNKAAISIISIGLLYALISGFSFFGAAYAKVVINILLCLFLFLIILANLSQFRSNKINTDS